MSVRPVAQVSERAVAIIGVGLIGGSIAAALKKRGYRGEIIGVGRSDERLKAAQAAGLIDRGTTEIADAAANASLLIFCTPVDEIVDGVRAALPACQAGTLMTDAGSVKGAICTAIAGGLPDRVTFIGSHPLAGSEKRGFEYAQPDLFEGRVCVIVPDDDTPEAEVMRLAGFWHFIGMNVIPLSAAEHDRTLARTSHVPHVAAAALALTLLESDRMLAATGFRDTTRIAAGDPSVWIPILLQNRDAIVAGLDRYEHVLEKFRQAVANEDTTALRELLAEAKHSREALDG